jgi:hypothetical protein
MYAPLVVTKSAVSATHTVCDDITQNANSCKLQGLHPFGMKNDSWLQRPSLLAKSSVVFSSPFNVSTATYQG